VNEVVSKFKNIDPYYYSPSNQDVTDVFERALHHCDFPATGSSFISQYFLMQLISKNGIKVVLDGQGADEYLGGYMHSYYRLIGDMLSRFQWSNAWNVTGLVGDNLGLSAVSRFSHFGKSVLNSLLSEQQLYRLEYAHYYPFLVRQMSGKTPFTLSTVGDSRLDRFLYNLLFSTSLPSLLHFEDRNSMAFSIESRVPFLDHRLVEFAFSLNDSDRVNGLSTKRILRESMKDIIPNAIYARKDKKGFVTPGESKWLHGPLSHLLDDSLKIPSFLDQNRVKALLKRYRNGDQSVSTIVWRLVVLMYWIKRI
jgi:asparagine synthase (glutamine-hydrolysing)